MDEQITKVGMDRRFFLKGAAVAGATVWAAPTIQSMIAPAVAQSASCQGYYVRFKYDVGSGFDNGDASGGGASWCLPDGYAAATALPNTSGNTLTFVYNGHTITITVEISADGKTATITITGAVGNIDLSAKAGSNETNGACGETTTYATNQTVYTISISKTISFVAGTMCILQ